MARGYHDINRPCCEAEDCTQPAQVSGRRRDGSYIYRRRLDTGYVCTRHHHELTARSAGFDTSTGWRNKDHPYRRYRKDYCENRDGRLGDLVCTATIVDPCQLDVDHIDGNPSNNDPSNLQTLCKNCHAYKTWAWGDAHTPGRDSLRRDGIINW